MVDGRSASDLPIAVFYRSIPKAVAVVLLWSVLTALGTSVVLGCIISFAATDSTAADYVPLAFWLLCGLVLVLLSGSVLFVYLMRVVRVPYSPIIEVSRAGLRDRRISPDIIPWSSIESIWWLPPARQLQLILDSAVDNSLPRSAYAVWARRRMLQRFLYDAL